MPFKSKQQAKLFYAAANKEGGIKGLAQDTAKKFIEDSAHQSLKNLPSKAKPHKFGKLAKMLKGDYK